MIIEGVKLNCIITTLASNILKYHLIQGGEDAVSKANEVSQVEAIKKYGTYTNFQRILDWNLEDSGRDYNNKDNNGNNGNKSDINDNKIKSNLNSNKYGSSNNNDNNNRQTAPSGTSYF